MKGHGFASWSAAVAAILVVGSVVAQASGTAKSVTCRCNAGGNCAAAPKLVCPNGTTCCCCRTGVGPWTCLCKTPADCNSPPRGTICP